jgi:hypothetical protein
MPDNRLTHLFFQNPCHPDRRLFEMVEVKHFDMFKELSINTASEHLLEKGLAECGCIVKRDMAVSAGRSLAAANQQMQP